MDVEVVTRDDVRDAVCIILIIIVLAAAAARDVGFWGAFYELAQKGMGGPIRDVLL